MATSKEKLDNHMGDVWDSGRVESRNSISVEYAGSLLQYQTTYYWKVRVWGSNQQVSDYSFSQAFQLDTIHSTQTSANTFQVEHLAPVLFQQKGKESYFLDFGKDAFATLEFDYEAKTKHTLTIRIGEQCLLGQINRQPEGTIRYQEIQVPVVPGKNKYMLPIKPDERNTKPGAILLPDSCPVLLPFRYAEFENVLGKLSAEGIRQVAYHSYWEENQSTFTSSDTILNRIWELCKYSIKATTFAGIYVDGDRERIPYEADAYLNQLSHYCVDREYAMARQTIAYFFDSRPTWPTEWQLHVAMMLYQDYMYTGNTELIERYYERLKVKTLMALEVEDGFISIESPKHNWQFLLELGFPDSTIHLNDIVDWPPESDHFGNIKRYQKGERDGYVFTRINTVVNAFYYHNMRIMAQFAALLDKPDEALDFEYRAARVKKAINEQLFDKEKGYYRDGIGTDHGSLHANMVLLAFDVVPSSRQQGVAQHLKTKGMACSVYGAQYLMEALYKTGESDYARTLLS
ncbi:MAG: trehalase family glycosidase, partial [Haliscomenobacter sp.]